MGDDDFKYGQAISTLLQSLLSEVRENSVALASFNAELRIVRETTTSLSKLIKEGDGGSSLVSKVDQLGQSVSNLAEIPARVSRVEQIQNDRTEERKDRRESRGQMLAFLSALAVAMIGLAVALIK